MKLDAVKKARKKLGDIFRDIIEDMGESDGQWAAYITQKDNYDKLWKEKKMNSTMKIQPQEVYQMFDNLKRFISEALDKYNKGLKDLAEDHKEYGKAFDDFMRAAEEAGLTK